MRSKSYWLPLVTCLATAASMAGCGSDDDTTPSNHAGSAGTGTAGRAGSGTAGNAGRAGGGTAGSGTAGSGTAGSGTAGSGTAGAGGSTAGTGGISAGGTGGSTAGSGGTGGTTAGSGGTGGTSAGAGGTTAGTGGTGGTAAGAGGTGGSTAGTGGTGGTAGSGGTGGAAGVNLCDKQIWKYTFQMCPHAGSDNINQGAWNAQPTLAVDGNTATYATSGKAQDGTFYLMVDLHGAANVSGLTIDYVVSAGDQSITAPLLEASNDGLTFTAVAGTVFTPLANNKVTMSVPPGVTHRFLRLRQQGTGGAWWAVPEFSLTCSTNGTPAAPPADAATTKANWKILTPNSVCNPTEAAKMQDADNVTAWQTVGKPGVNYWVRVDLGIATALTNVNMKAPNATDFPATLKLQTSTDDITYTDAKTGVAGATDTKFVLTTPTTARFFRIVSTADVATDSWWSISDIAINVP